MGVAVLRESLDNFTALPLPQPPAEYRANSADEAFKEFRDAVRTYSMDVSAWKVQISKRWEDMRSFVDSAVAENIPELNDFVVEEFLPEVISKLDDLISHIRHHLQKADDQEAQMQASVRRVPILAKMARKAHRDYKRLLSDQHDFTVRLYYETLALKADLDPDARGGPAFTDATELDRYLRENVGV